MRAVVDEIRLWFEACGYVVSEQVGAVEGRVDRFATPRHGLMPPRTWWTVVASFPDDLAAASEDLDLERGALGADRALAIVTDDVTAKAYDPDLKAGVANYVSWRHLALHLAGVFDELSAMVREPPDLPYFAHRLQSGSGATVDASEHIDVWIDQGTEDEFALEGGPRAAIVEIIHEVARRRAKRFLERPNQVVPLVLARSTSSPPLLLEMLLQRRWAVHAHLPAIGEGPVAIRRREEPDDFPGSFSRSLAELALPSIDEAVAWFRAAAPKAPIDPLRAWFVRDELAPGVVQWPTLRLAILRAASEETRSPLDDAWLPQVLASTFLQALEQASSRTETSVLVEDAALREFALGEAQLSEVRSTRLRKLAHVGLLVPDEQIPQTGGARRYQFASTCVRDWFLARKIARDVRADNRDVLTRHVFPRMDVGLFLAVIAPDVAALAGAGQAEELRRNVESEVARRVELTLGHQLNRSIGTISAHTKTIRRALRESDIDERTRTAFSRIDEELEHLSKLTERSRLLNESDKWQITSLALGDIVAGVTDPLREKHARVDVTVTVPDEVTVRAARDGLREILHCIVENAFHSVGALPEGRPRKIEIAARREGETVRVHLKDNGIGVRPEDRERIFQPFVTTKTGGPGQPRGTGLGLSIARTFAERMGARVTLESSNGETVFVIVLVAGE